MSTAKEADVSKMAQTRALEAPHFFRPRFRATRRISTEFYVNVVYMNVHDIPIVPPKIFSRTPLTLSFPILSTTITASQDFQKDGR